MLISRCGALARMLLCVALLGPVSGTAAGVASSSAPARWDAGSSGWQENLRWTLDASSRARLDGGADDVSSGQALGLDVYKVFSSPRGDIGTLILQPYLVWIPEEDQRPAYFDDDREVELTWRRVVKVSDVRLVDALEDHRLGQVARPAADRRADRLAVHEPGLCGDAVLR